MTCYFSLFLAKTAVFSLHLPSVLTPYRQSFRLVRDTISRSGPLFSLREIRTSGWTPGEKCPLWLAFRPGRRLSACFCVLLIYGVRRARSSAYPAKSPGCRSSLASRLCQPLSVESWQASRGDTCLANSRILFGKSSPSARHIEATRAFPLVLGLTYSQLFTFHRVLWRCAATSGARGRHASVLMLCVSGKNIKAGVLRRKKLLKKQLLKRTFIYLCSVKSVSPEETDEARPRCGAGPVCQRGAGTFFHHSHARSPHCRKLRLLFFRPPRDAPAPVPASAGTGAACAGAACPLTACAVLP